MSNTPQSFFNGQPGDQISAFDRGFYYGHGLFETVRIHNGKLPLWELHLRRLQAGANRLGLAVDKELLTQYMRQCLATKVSDGVLKIVLTGGEGGRGYAAPEQLQSNYLLQVFPLSEGSSHYAECGVELWVCEQRLADAPALAGIKHLNRLEQVLARAEQPASVFPEGLMLDNKGNVIEAIAGNLFCYRHGEWLTPKLDRCGVAGVMREYLLQQHSVVQCDIALSELPEMDEVFICNSVRGIWPVTGIKDIGEWSAGSETRQWQQQLARELTCFQV